MRVSSFVVLCCLLALTTSVLVVHAAHVNLRHKHANQNQLQADVDVDVHADVHANPVNVKLCQLLSTTYNIPFTDVPETAKKLATIATNRQPQIILGPVYQYLVAAQYSFIDQHLEYIAIMDIEHTPSFIKSASYHADRLLYSMPITIGTHSHVANLVFKSMLDAKALPNIMDPKLPPRVKAYMQYIVKYTSPEGQKQLMDITFMQSLAEQMSASNFRGELNYGYQGIPSASKSIFDSMNKQVDHATMAPAPTQASHLLEVDQVLEEYDI